MSSLNELKTFCTVIINELRTIKNIFSLQVAKFYINQILFYATTSGIRCTDQSKDRISSLKSQVTDAGTMTISNEVNDNNVDDFSSSSAWYDNLCPIILSLKFLTSCFKTQDELILAVFILQKLH